MGGLKLCLAVLLIQGCSWNSATKNQHAKVAYCIGACVIYERVSDDVVSVEIEAREVEVSSDVQP